MTTNTIYFPGLNGLRFLAAFLVIVHHIEQFKGIYKLPNHFHLAFINIAGGLGVTLFFVLSGYLITYLLLKEKKQYNTISLPKFYIRRILRIWPLYYLLVILGFFVFPNIIPNTIIPSVRDSNFHLNLLLYVCLIPNISLQFFNAVPFIAPLWSVGVEEQFYLIWPVIIKFIKIKLVTVLLIIIASISFLRYLLPFSNNSIISNFGFFLELFRIDCMAIGGVFAYLLFHKKDNILNVIFNRVFQTMSFIVLFICLFKGLIFPFHHTVYAVLFGLIIINVSTNPKSILKLEWKPIIWLGKISYGLYVFHGVIIFSILYYFRNLINSINNLYLRDVFIYSIVFFFTISISYLSYNFYEKRFLRIKQKYTLVKSGSL